VTGSNEKEIVKLKRQMMTEYEMTDLGKLSYFLGMEFVSCEKGIFLHQKKYITDVLKRFKMLDCKPVSTPVDTTVKLQKNKRSS
jgi:hypothetical protein